MAAVNDESITDAGSRLWPTQSPIDADQDGTTGGLSDGGQEAFQALDEFIMALREARAEIRRTETFLLRVRKRVSDGEPIESLIMRLPLGDRRRALAVALDQVTRSRHKVRQKVFSVAVERGVSCADLARAWGFSRQLAARYAKDEARM